MPLTLVPTPIGNLEDITLRALRILREADLIACEDTRTSGVLLRHYDIHVPLTSFHAHNENEKVNSLLERLREGAHIAVISDAGTPGISDPGWILLKRAIDEGLDVDVLPGASAVIPAVLLSGISPQPFIFAGFIPDRLGERVKFFECLREVQSTLCFYVSPHKAERHIADMIESLGNRNASLVREISKVFQEVIRSNLEAILERVREGIKGELVLVVEGYSPESEGDIWKEEAVRLLEEGMSVKDIVSELEARHKIPKNAVKKYIMSKKILPAPNEQEGLIADFTITAVRTSSPGL